MWNVAQPVRYQSIALTSVQRCIALTNALARLHITPAIRYLFVSIPWATDRARPSAKAELCTALTTLLRTAAPHVRVLVIHEPSVLVCTLAPAHAFPALEALSLPQLHALTGPGGEDRFPALRRVHLGSMLLVRERCDVLAACGPRVTHLRVAFHGRDDDVRAFLRVVLDAPAALDAGPMNGGVVARGCVEREHRPGAAKEIGAHADVVWPSGLQHVYVQMLARGDCRACVDRVGGHDCLHRDLESIAREQNERSGRKIWVLSNGEKYSVDEARADWEDLVMGGDGPWSYASACSPHMC